MNRKIKILIAEDEVLIAQCLQMELEMSGYEVCGFVATGEEAILKTRDTKPDIVLMDINLSGEMDGIEAAQKIIAENKIPLIFMTGYNEPNFLKRAEKVNPVGYLEKPVEIYNLQPLIDSVFK